MLASHCGRPKGQVNEKMRMAPMAVRLGELLGKEVATVGDCIGTEVEAASAKLGDGDVLMLENARFYKEEEKNVSEFAEKLALERAKEESLMLAIREARATSAELNNKFLADGDALLEFGNRNLFDKGLVDWIGAAFPQSALL